MVLVFSVKFLLLQKELHQVDPALLNRLFPYNCALFNFSARPSVLQDRQYPKITIQCLNVTVRADRLRTTRRFDDSERRLGKGTLYVWLNQFTNICWSLSMESCDCNFHLNLAYGLRFSFSGTNTKILIIKGYLPRKLHINEHS